MVESHNPSSDLDNLCENIITNAYFSRFTHENFDKLGSYNKNEVKEAILASFKSIRLEFNQLIDRVEQKKQFSLTIERQIREEKIAQFMPSLNKKMIAKAMNMYKARFVPKYRSFKILRNNVEVVTQSTLLWKTIYGIHTTTVAKKVDEGKKKPKEGDVNEGVQATKVPIKDGSVDGTKEIAAEEATTKDEH